MVSVFAATKEGLFDAGDINGEKIGLIKSRGHAASMVTLGMEVLARRAPDVSFIHDYPGPVKSGIGREMQGLVGVAVRTLASIIGPLLYIPTDESGAYHLYFATSARYAPKSGLGPDSGTPTNENAATARGTDGSIGSGMYSIDERGESASSSVEQLLADMRKDGTSERLWEHTESQWQRIIGAAEAKL